MGYYIRVLGTKDPGIDLGELHKALQANNLTAELAIDDTNTSENWTLLHISNAKGEALAQVERNPVAEGELGQEELDEFREDVMDYKPGSAATWLVSYFDKVKVIYAFQLLDVIFEDDNFNILSNIKETIWNRVGGILQADGEGFSNEEGYHILWQFSDNVTGEWSCAIQNAQGGWDNFIMDLSDKTQRKQFEDGLIPQNAKRI